MKKLGILIFVFISATTQGQSTISQARDSITVLNKRLNTVLSTVNAILTKLVVKDTNDNRRNVRISALEGWKDSTKIYFLSIDDFDIDSSKTARIKPKTDTVSVIIKRQR